VTLSLKNGCFQVYLLVVIYSTILSTYKIFKTLTKNLGCFPLNFWSYHQKFVFITTYFYLYTSHAPLDKFLSIQSFPNLGKIFKPPANKKSSTPQKKVIILYLHRFRRKPAISKFDWTFTPNSYLSLYFSTYESSVYINLTRIRSLSFGFNNYNF